jgi:hypothetical protein
MDEKYSNLIDPTLGLIVVIHGGTSSLLCTSILFIQGLNLTFTLHEGSAQHMNQNSTQHS